VALAQRFFSAAEAAAVDAAGERGRERCFLRCWTRREAVLKASGRGIGVDLQALEVGVSPAPLLLRLPGDGRELHVQDLDLGADWIGALCVALPDGAGQPPRVHMAGHLAARTRSRTGIAA
jgi:4'-phosphopantetheinyl transferase